MFKKPLCYLLLFLIFTGCNRDLDKISEPEKDEPSIQSSSVNNTLRIKISQELAYKLETAVKAEDYISLDNISKVKRTFPVHKRFEARTRKEGLHLWYDVTVTDKNILTKTRNEISQLEGVIVVETVPEIKRNSLPFNDPLLIQQWHYNNTGSGTNFLAGSDINVFDAWSITTGRPEVIVAVVDGGVDFNHEDLAANMWINLAELNGSQGVDDDGNGYVDDIHGYNFVTRNQFVRAENHGTHVAGTIAAVNNNAKGVSGIAGGNGLQRGVSIMTCQIFDDYDQRSGDVVQAIKYAADNGAVICQNSWGYTDATSLPASTKAAIDYFVAYAGIDEHGNQTGPMRGGLVTFSAGNDYRDIAFPASYNKVMAVAAIAPDFKRSYYSNYGSWVDIAAPGGSAHYTNGRIMSTVANNAYAFMQGTSMACPHVSGVAALVVSKFGKEGFTNDMLWEILVSSARNIDSYNPDFIGLLGSGLVDAFAALNSESTLAPDEVDEIFTSVNSNSITLKWIVTADRNDDKAFGFNIYSGRNSLTDLDVDNLPAGVTKSSVNTGFLNTGDTISVTLSGLNFNTRYYFRIEAFNSSGYNSRLSPQAEAVTAQNNNPVITPLNGTEITLKPHQTITAMFAISDPDGHQLTYTFTPGSAAATATRSGGLISVRITGMNANSAVYTARLSVFDPYDGHATLDIVYEILPNTPPRVTGTPSNVYFGGIGLSETISLDNYFTDDDGEQLNYTAQLTNSSVARAQITGNQLTLTSTGYGITDITVSASDVRGESRSVTFKVLARDGREEVDIYPNPVIEKLNIRTGEQKSAEISLFSVTGARVYNNSAVISPFNPAVIDMKDMSGGVYSIVIRYDNKEIKRQIIKN